MSTLTVESQMATYTGQAAILPAITVNPVRRTEPRNRQQALQAIYDAHVEQIYKFAFYKVGNREDAEDITSQVFIKAAQSLDVEQEEATRLAWLYQVARTTITDHWRGFYKSPSSSLEQLEEVSPLHLAAEALRPGMVEEEDCGLAQARVAAVLRRLPDNYRRVLELRFLQGCSLKETAEAMGITEGNAKVLQHRALHKAVQVGSLVM
jgi:RNA polymerase sigma-70 factor, ECF subfamily